MEITRTPFPLGHLQGFPAMVVDCYGAKPEQLVMLPRLVRSYMRPADDLIWLRNLDWSQAEAIESMLTELSSHERTARATPVAVRKLGEEHWPSTTCYWILDCSDLLREPTDPDTVRDRTQDLPYFPNVDELVVIRPHTANLSPMIWDELLNWITPDGPSWAYVEPEDYAKACDCMYKADHRAGVRSMWCGPTGEWSSEPC